MRNDGSARGLLGRGAVTRVDATVNSLAGCSPCRANARKTESCRGLQFRADIGSLTRSHQGAVFAAFWVSSLERATAFVAAFSPEKVRFMDGVESTKLLDAVQPGGAHAQHSFGTTVLPQYYAVALGFDLVRDTTHQLLVRARTDVLYSAPVIIADNTAAITV